MAIVLLLPAWGAGLRSWRSSCNPCRSMRMQLSGCLIHDPGWVAAGGTSVPAAWGRVDRQEQDGPVVLLGWLLATGRAVRPVRAQRAQEPPRSALVVLAKRAVALDRLRQRVGRWPLRTAGRAGRQRRAHGVRRSVWPRGRAGIPRPSWRCPPAR